MREKVPGFDPFYNGWAAYDQGGFDAVNQKEAPLFMYPFDEADPALAEKLVKLFGSQDPDHPELGLLLSDLRFGLWPDASPVQVREENEQVGIHLNSFGSRQVRYGKASEVERVGLEVVTFEAEELVRDAIDPEFGVSVHQWGKVPTLHRHIVAREKEEDGTTNWLERQLVSLETRQAMRARVAHEATDARLDKIATHIGDAFLRFVKD